MIRATDLLHHLLMKTAAEVKDDGSTSGNMLDGYRPLSHTYQGIPGQLFPRSPNSRRSITDDLSTRSRDLPYPETLQAAEPGQTPPYADRLHHYGVRHVNADKPYNLESSYFSPSRNTVETVPNRSTAMHEATHALDPNLRPRGRFGYPRSWDLARAAGTSLKPPGGERVVDTPRESEVPAMASEIQEISRKGWQPDKPNLWINQIRKFGPKMTGNDANDVDNIHQFMTDLRSDTPLGRTYNQWVKAQSDKVPFFQDGVHPYPVAPGPTSQADVQALANQFKARK